MKVGTLLMNPHGRQKMKTRKRPELGQDGNVIVMALLGLVLVVLLGFGLPRLLQRREPGLEGDAPTAATSSEKKKSRTSIFGQTDEESTESSEKHVSAQKADGAGRGSETESDTEGFESHADDHDASLTRASSWGKDAEGLCTAVEEPGFRGSDIKLTQKVWLPLVEDFRAAKRKVVAWIKKHPEQFPEERFKVLSERILELQIQRPPSEEEPDLAWRGTVVMSRFPDGKPLLRVGGGFLTLHQKDPKRAQFELARAVSFLLSPCELKGMGYADVWEQTLTCAQGVPSETCDLGSVSQQAWLVASAVAQEVQPAGCQVRAVEASGFLGCLAGSSRNAATPTAERSIASVATPETEDGEAEVEGGHSR